MPEAVLGQARMKASPMSTEVISPGMDGHDLTGGRLQNSYATALPFTRAGRKRKVEEDPGFAKLLWRSQSPVSEQAAVLEIVAATMG